MQNSTPLAWLIGNEGTPGEVRFELTGSETTLGRGSDCEIQVDDQHASRQHAAIHFFDGGYQIKDLDSSNGTFVNDKRITSLPLSEGDKIQIGDSILRVRLEQDLDATIIQKISPQSTSTASVTIPREPVIVDNAGSLIQKAGSSVSSAARLFRSCRDLSKRLKRPSRKPKPLIRRGSSPERNINPP